MVESSFEDEARPAAAEALVVDLDGYAGPLDALLVVQQIKLVLGWRVVGGRFTRHGIFLDRDKIAGAILVIAYPRFIRQADRRF